MAPGRAPTISSLPDAVLTHVLNEFGLVFRHETAALVCRRWRDIVNSPPLLRCLDVVLYSRTAQRFTLRLQSFAHWLAVRVAPHVQQLRLMLCLAHDVSDDEEEGEEEEEEGLAAEASIVLAGLLASCGGPSSQLRELSLTLQGVSLPVSSWLASIASSLQKLQVQSGNREPLVVSCLPPLPALRELELGAYSSAHDAGGLVLRPAARLPTSLTKLDLERIKEDALQPQVGTLANLESLRLKACAFTPEGYTPLARLSSSLRRLHICDCAHLPACLGQLTSLEVLHVDHTGGEAEEAGSSAGVLTAALPQLTELTSLLLTSLPGMRNPPAELAGLPSLRCFAWAEPAADVSSLAVLPAGAWLAGLERLLAPADVLFRSLQQLAAARQLVQLGIANVDGRSREHLFMAKAGADVV